MNRQSISYLVALAFILSVTSVGAQENKAVPESFMKLYHDFTGVHEGKSTTIAQELANALEAKERMGADGPLVLVVESGIYEYDHETRKLIAKVDLRSSDPNCGFIELTAISHVGPAIAYTANLKELGNSYWKVGLQNLFEHLKEARVANASSTSDNWLDTTSALAMQMRKEDRKGSLLILRKIPRFKEISFLFTGSFRSLLSRNSGHDPLLGLIVAVVQ